MLIENIYKNQDNSMEGFHCPVFTRVYAKLGNLFIDKSAVHIDDRLSIKISVIDNCAVFGQDIYLSEQETQQLINFLKSLINNDN